MKKLFQVIALTLAANFLALGGGVWWLYRQGRLGPQQVKAIKEILFPPATDNGPSTRPDGPTTQPSEKLEELLQKYAGRPPAEQLEFIQRSFDSRMTQLEREKQVLVDWQHRLDQLGKQLADDRAALDAEKAKLKQQQEEAQRAATDKGFQDSLELYQTLPAKQVKTIFMGLTDKTIIQYLEAMDRGQAGKIIKEFKSPEEIERVKKVLELMRQAQAGGKEQ